MNHREARQHLVGLADKSLPEPTRTQTAAHAEDCSRCRSWLTTYQGIEEALRVPREHPTSEILAAYAVEPADLAEDAQSEIRSHLARCASCAADYRVTRQALAASRPDEENWIPNAAERVTPRRMQPWAEAGLLAAVLLLALVVVGPESEQSPTLSDSVIRGQQVVESDQRLLASNVQLAESSNLQLKATQGVVLREGFSVEKGARLSIATDRQSDQTQ